MEVMESIGVGVLSENDDPCPFDHSNRKPKDIKNDLIGIGTTLGEKMEKGEGTRTGETGLKADPQPKDDPKHTLFKKPTPIRVPTHTPEYFPLTCAAHHLIPAQASMRPSTLIKWLVHGSVSSQTKDGKGTGTGKLEVNVGYDVNGAQNGIWLPGPYALSTGAVAAPSTKKKGRSVATGLKSTAGGKGYKPDDDPDSDLDDEDTPPGGPSAGAPDGAFAVERAGTANTTTAFEEAPTAHEGAFPALYSYYFVYTVSSMLKVNGQYHDAHGKYSKQVRTALDEMEVKVHNFALGIGCDKCKEKNKERTEDSTDFPPPRRLIGTLNGLSKKLSGLVKFPASTWKWPMYTSKMAFHYWTYRKDNALNNL
jgi:hypothetical protein